MRFCYSISNQKSIEKSIFAPFGKILVLVNAFFLFNFKLKKYCKIDFCSFWQDLGFGECVFSFQFLIKKDLKNCFLQQILVLANFCIWQDFGFGKCVFSIQFLIKKVFKN